MDASTFPALASGAGVLTVGGVLEGNSAAVAGGGLHVDGGVWVVVLDGIRVSGLQWDNERQSHALQPGRAMHTYLRAMSQGSALGAAQAGGRELRGRG